MNGELLRHARVNARLTLKELSDLCDVDPLTISDIEHARNSAPAYDKVVVLANALRLKPEQLWPASTAAR